MLCHMDNKNQPRLNCLWESAHGSPLIKANDLGTLGKGKIKGKDGVGGKLAGNTLGLALPPTLPHAHEEAVSFLYAVSQLRRQLP
jgi:hypothetical protein